MSQYPIDVEIREFSCFDDFDNDGWGNSTIEEREIPLEKDDSDYTGEED
jgi:hypothetical protein